MRIDCLKYRWDTSTDKSDVNFFSDEVPTLVQTVDLFPFLIKDSMSNIEYGFEDIDENNSLYFTASNVSFQCISDNQDNLINAFNLIDFFEVFEVNEYIRWRINVYNNSNTLIYSGILSKDGISIDGVSKKLLDITVVGEEKETQRYFSNKKLVPTEELPLAVLPIPLNLTGLQFFWLGDVLKRNFPTVNFQFERDLTNFIGKYYVANRPYTYSNLINTTLNGTLHIKTGYKSFYNDNVDRYTWFNSLCLAMGWTWFFYLGELVIRRRSDSDYPTLTIDANESNLKTSVTNNVQQFPVDNVIIADGQYYGDTSETSETAMNYALTFVGPFHYLGGDRAVVFSKDNDYWNYTRPFNSLLFNSLPGGGYYIRGLLDWTFARREEDNNFLYKTMSLGLQTREVVERQLNFTKQKTLFINPVVCSTDYGGTLDVTLARTVNSHFYGNGNCHSIDYSEETDVNRISYTGNVATSLLMYDTTRDLYLTYEDYTNTLEFKNNFSKYISSNNQIIFSGDFYGEMSNPLQTIEFTNYAYANFTGKKFSIQRLNFHPINKTYSLTLIQLP